MGVLEESMKNYLSTHLLYNDLWKMKIIWILCSEHEAEQWEILS